MALLRRFPAFPLIFASFPLLLFLPSFSRSNATSIFVAICPTSQTCRGGKLTQYMEDSSSAQQAQRSVTMEDGKFCKCDEGWTCNITPTEATKAGNPFSNCGSSCICITDAASGNQISDLQKTLESSATGKVFCKCDEGWTCVISKVDGPQAGKAFFECGEGCICVIDESNKLQVTCA